MCAAKCGDDLAEVNSTITESSGISARSKIWTQNENFEINVLLDDRVYSDITELIK